jgi:hypothetical protein
LTARISPVTDSRSAVPSGCIVEAIQHERLCACRDGNSTSVGCVDVDAGTVKVNQMGVSESCVP